ncbi:MAG: transposase [Kiritimatiellaeota bacterium]|nr:transposase [Kiritimatiellota bacterium]
MDNTTFHRKARLRAMAAEHGCAVLFLPPDSPDLNPAGKFWARLKVKLREIMHRCQSLASAINKAFQEIVYGEWLIFQLNSL